MKFVADSEEVDIYSIKDVMHRDDREVNNFSDLMPGTKVVARWPLNSKMYDAVVMSPLVNTGELISVF